MFVVEISYLVAKDDINPFLQAHRDYWDFYFQEGLLIAEGPMLSANGSVLIFLGNELSAIEPMLEKDPLHLAGVSQHRITQFSATKCTDSLKSLIFNAPKSGVSC